ncbi:MAG: hypothetical protein EXQ50_02800 [Acidobacteria bacterium]|nr:hypothetical protein [Acidobacteriota bacterium]
MHDRAGQNIADNALSMRILLALICASLVTVAGSAQSQRPDDLVGVTFEAHVVGVVDGDTLDIVRAHTKRKIRIRLDGVDSPETGEPFSQQAKNFSRVSAFDRNVSVVGKDVDRYGRLVARIQAEGKDLSVEVVAAGLACHFLRYSSDPTLAKAEANARASGLGFWANGAPKPRCVELNQPQGLMSGAAQSSGFFGNVNSKVYHAPTCRNAHCKNCTKEFRTREEAEEAGYRAAGDCLR